MRRSRQTTKQKNHKLAPRHTTQPFVAHLLELRRRLFFVAIFVIVFTSIGAVIREKLISVLLAPAHGQQFIYTTPGGGFNFNFTICLYFGFALSVPVVVYHLFRYLEPMLKNTAGYTILKTTIASTLLAAIGVVFGYLVGLPGALNFLLHQFTTDQIEALLSIQDYMSFVMIYLVGFAMMFQIPLILLFINRIKPLKPKQLFGYQRFVIVIAFIIAAIITPTPDAMNQALMAGPIIAMYQFGVVLVWLANKRSKIDAINALKQRDELERARRIQQAQTRPIPQQPVTTHLPHLKPTAQPAASPTRSPRPSYMTNYVSRNLVQ